MRKLKVVLILLVIILLQTKIALAGFKYGGVGGRAMAMGGAFTAVADDASALYYNPAGIAQLTEREGIFTHARKFDVLDVDFIALTSGRLGISYLGQGVDLESKAYGKIRMSEAAYGLSLARKIYPKLSLGATLKSMVMQVTHRDIGKDSSIALDLSVFYKHSERLQFGVATRNAGAKMWNEDVPLEATAGAAYRIPEYKLLVAVDMFNKEDYGAGGGVIGYRLGAEMKLKQVLGLRVGLNDGHLTCGAGIDQERWGFDGAYIHYKNHLDLPAYYFSTKLKF